ncbi:MAG TPA: COX15/CtaA family protein, partial [Tepidisphaeraceae bacterium]|nr:COX15/CtaA family protein [Tepidisphaeraceae bacterium]
MESETMQTGPFNRGLFIWTVLTGVATLVLIFLGAIVTSKGAGMSVPDWPNSYGYNMFLFPTRLWQGNIRFEHIHRLVASGVGMMGIVMVVWAWRTDRRKYVRWMSVAVLVGVIIQGILG